MSLNQIDVSALDRTMDRGDGSSTPGTCQTPISSSERNIVDSGNNG